MQIGKEKSWNEERHRKRAVTLFVHHWFKHIYTNTSSLSKNTKIAQFGWFWPKQKAFLWKPHHG